LNDFYLVPFFLTVTGFLAVVAEALAAFTVAAGFVAPGAAVEAFSTAGVGAVVVALTGVASASAIGVTAVVGSGIGLDTAAAM
jgi:hypothetical protein